MLQSVRALVMPSVQSRLVLLVNHVLSREPVAMQRMRAHAGRRVRVDVTGAPAWLPAQWLPAATVQVSPAGLLEIDESAGAPDLSLRVAAPAPTQLLAALAGQARPQVQVEGDAALAADMNWLVDNLRWDIEADLSQAIGPAAAHQVVRVARGVAAALRAAVPGGAGAGDTVGR
jgi:ubiquinone biosynthesis accessory factor UbiJ